MNEIAQRTPAPPGVLVPMPGRDRAQAGPGPQPAAGAGAPLGLELRHLRYFVMLAAAGCPEQIAHVDRRDQIAQAAGRYGLAEIHAFIARLDATARQLRENVNPQLALENALLHLPGASP